MDLHSMSWMELVIYTNDWRQKYFIKDLSLLQSQLVQGVLKLKRNPSMFEIQT